MGTDAYPTKHVLEKIQARDVTWGEIVEVIEKPEVIYGPDFRGRKVLQRGTLTVVLGRDGAVVTVLLRSEEQWDDTDMKTRVKGDAAETPVAEDLSVRINERNQGQIRRGGL